MHRLLVLVAAGWLVCSAGKLRAVAGVVGGCASTPAAALLAARNGADTGAGLVGYRVGAVRWDPLLRQSWAVIKSCDHPDQTPQTMLTDLPAAHAEARLALAAARTYAVLPIVRAGDLVRLWRSDRSAHIELIGTSEENGGVGSRVRIRLAASRDPDGQVEPTQYLAGVVRGPADVEMER